uniref:Putative glycoprotein n=1 Tax=Hubei bunya-like virus 7 TaxID=1922852 RepID=A0A1L3KPP6_9VIRU|nr:putative glycoprotein [Hubei bunya-like virus 7]
MMSTAAKLVLLMVLPQVLKAVPDLNSGRSLCRMVDVQRVGSETWYVSLTCTHREMNSTDGFMPTGFKTTGVELVDVQAEEWESDKMPIGFMIAKYKLINNHQRPSMEDSNKLRLLKNMPKSEDCHGAHQQVRLRSFKPHNSASYKTGPDCLKMVSSSDQCFDSIKMTLVEKQKVRLACAQNCTKANFAKNGGCFLKTSDVLGKYMCGKADNEIVVCSAEASGLSCEWSATTTDLGINMVRVTLTAQDVIGKVSFISGELDTSQLCSKSCLFEVPEHNKYATLICPNGDLHHVAIVRFEPSNCPLAQYEFIRPFALHVCQNTSWPVLLLVTLLWILFGRYICSGIVLLQCWLRCKLQSKLARNRRQKELTDCPPSCIFCGCATDNIYMAELHVACQSGICPFCKHKITEPTKGTTIDIDEDSLSNHLNKTLSGHARECYSRTLAERIRKDAADQALKLEQQKCQPMRYRMWLGNLYWMLLAAVLILVLFVPAHAHGHHGVRHYLGTDGNNDFYRYRYNDTGKEEIYYRSVPTGTDLTGDKFRKGVDSSTSIDTLPKKVAIDHPDMPRDREDELVEERAAGDTEFTGRGKGYDRTGFNMTTCSGQIVTTETKIWDRQVCSPLCEKIPVHCSPIMKAGCSIECEVMGEPKTECCYEVYIYYLNYYWNQDEAAKKCMSEDGFNYNFDINTKGVDAEGFYQPFNDNKKMRMMKSKCPVIVKPTDPPTPEPTQPPPIEEFVGNSTEPNEEIPSQLTSNISSDDHVRDELGWVPSSYSQEPGIVGELYSSVKLLTFKPKTTGVVSALSMALEICPETFCIKYGESCSCFVDDYTVVPDHHFTSDTVQIDQRSIAVSRAKREVATEPKNQHQHSMDKLVSDMLITPWGVVTIKDVWRPAYSTQHSMLEWSNVVEEDDNSLTFSGMIEGELKMEVQTAVKWEVGNKKVKPKIATVSIVEFAQLYTTQLKYITFDRHISKDSEMTCTGDCHVNCSKSNANKLITKWPNDRRWNCNPGWCWAVNNGCTCCVLDYTTEMAKYALMVFDISYESTIVILCFSLGFDSRTCKSIKAGETETQVMDGITLETSELVGDASRLPEGTTLGLLFHWTGGIWNLVDVNSMLLNPDVCKLNQCVHGQIGDIQLDDLTPLLSGDLSKAYKSFQGITASRNCHTGSWPNCVFSSVIPDLTELFENLNETSAHVSSKFHLMSNRISYNQNKPELQLELRPLQNFGSLKLKMKVDSLKFTKLQVKIEVSKFDLGTCKGCHSCSDGFSCEIKIKLKQPDPIAVHFTSKDQSIQLMQDSVIASDTETVHYLHGYTVLEDANLTVCLKESQNSCTSTKLKLKSIQAVVQMHSEQLFSTQDTGSNDCSFLSCFGDTSWGLGSIIGFSLTHLGWWTAVYVIAGLLGLGFLLFWLIPYCRGAAAIRYASKMATMAERAAQLRIKAGTGKQN